MREKGDKAFRVLDYCRSTVLGQEAALHDICLHVWSAEVDLGVDEDRPRGVYLVFGPTGTGKTETPKRIAEFLYGGKPAILPLNEFGRADSSDKFKDALATKILKTKHCGHVLILDEVEKASRDVVDVLISVFDEGRMLLEDGSYLDLRGYHIWATSNIGSKRLYTMAAEDSSENGIIAMRDFVFKEAAEELRPELFARADVQTFYVPLTDSVQRTILEMAVATKLQRLTRLLGGTPIKVDRTAIDGLIGLGFHDQTQGARKVKSIVNRQITLAANRACSDSHPPQAPLELRSLQLQGQATMLEFASSRASFSSLDGAGLALPRKAVPVEASATVL